MRHSNSVFSVKPQVNDGKIIPVGIQCLKCCTAIVSSGDTKIPLPFQVFAQHSSESLTAIDDQDRGLTIGSIHGLLQDKNINTMILLTR
jgi:hypothetical protein